MIISSLKQYTFLFLGILASVCKCVSSFMGYDTGGYISCVSIHNLKDCWFVKLLNKCCSSYERINIHFVYVRMCRYVFGTSRVYRHSGSFLFLDIDGLRNSWVNAAAVC